MPAERLHTMLRFAVLAALVLVGPGSDRAPLLRVAAFAGSGPEMYLYVPAQLPPSPAVLVGLHWCQGRAHDFFRHTSYAALAERYGFIVIYPSSLHPDRCWDVHSAESLSHAGGSDSRAIVAMVDYVVRTLHADARRVYVTGHSSGGMMTNVLLATYPDVFRAGAAFAGVPYGCFAGPGRWNADCAEGRVVRAGADWRVRILSAFPGYEGPRPRVQIWHGSKDSAIRVQNFYEQIKAWTSVLDASDTPSSTELDWAQPGFTRTRYRDAAGVVRVEAILEQGQAHNLEILGNEVVRFFDLDRAH